MDTGITVSLNEWVNISFIYDGISVKVYKNGTVFDTYEIKGSWGRTPSGWVCLDYCKLIYEY